MIWKKVIQDQVSDSLDDHSYLTPETLEEFKNGLKYLKLARIYTQRIDWLLSGDDGEDSFHRRLKEELGELE